MPRHLPTVVALAFLFGTVVFLLTRADGPAKHLSTPLDHRGATEPFSLAQFYAGVPYTSGWGSWWHPRRRRSGKSTIDGAWNILYHLGGNGPWIEKVDGVVEGGIGPPDGCSVQQVHMMSRHAERFPTSNAGARMLSALEHIKSLKLKLKGDLAFLDDWEYFSNGTSSSTVPHLTATGPYAGTLEAFSTGVKLRTRYEHLVADPREKPTNLWASDSSRVIDTARYFSAGFFGLDWERSGAKLHVIPETAELGADTLTPGDTCKAYREDLETGHDYGAAMLAKFRATYLGDVGRRLQEENPGLPLLPDEELYSMQELCGFETLVRGSSPWCDVFTRADWANFEYARDVIHYYRAGPGNPYGRTLGFLWLNATANLLVQGPPAGPLFFSFVHDGDIVPMLAALSLFPSPSGVEELPTTHVARDRAWRTSQVTPMGGRLIFERLSCAGRREPFVRINVNDGVVTMPGCASGPGRSCPLDEFMKLVAERGVQAGDFREVCGLGKDAAGEVTFLHQ
ncbi:MAG: acid phosphatase pho5 [Thelocarpon impressellum]|nr:MAG: acid phosphatase pho5 [Thelocarpon impressellum]